MRVCTAVPRSQLVDARALAASYRAHHPRERLAVLITDAFGSEPPEADDPAIEWVGYRDLGWLLYEAFAVSYDPVPFSIVVAPVLIRHLLGRGAPSVMYADAQSGVIGRLDAIGPAAERHGIVLWLRRGAPLREPGSTADDHELSLAGAFDPGLVAVGPGAAPFLDWWQERAAAMRVPAQWAQEGAPLFPYHPQRPGPLSPWDPSSASPLVRFDRLDPERPWIAEATSASGTDVGIFRHPLLARRWAERAAILAGGPSSQPPFAWHTGPDALPLDIGLRGAWAALAVQAANAGSSLPPSLQDRAELGRWMAASDADEPTGLPRFLASVYRSRLDLIEQFPDVAETPDARRRLLMWAHVAGAGEGVPADFLPPMPEGRVSYDPEPPAPGPRHKGVLLAGYLASEIGLGAAGRLIAAACERAGLPTATFTYRHLGGAQRVGWTDRHFEGEPTSIAETLIMCVNWGETPRLARTLGARYAGANRRIGVWFWELEVPHPAMAQGLDLVDEVWVTGDPALTAVRAAVAAARREVEVRVIPLGVDLGDRPSTPVLRADLRLPEGFMFLCAFDYASRMARKNPIGAVAAFQLAFPEPLSGGPILLVKSLNASRNTSDEAHLRWMCGGRPDIYVVDAAWSVDETHALVETSDAVVSLHRAEGYGLWLLEALARGKPVIATDHPGNRAFMHPDNSWLVPAAPVPVPDDLEPYNVGASWLEPDLGAAAQLFRTVFEGRGSAAVEERLCRARLDTQHLADGTASAEFIRSQLIQS